MDAPPCAARRCGQPARRTTSRFRAARRRSRSAPGPEHGDPCVRAPAGPASVPIDTPAPSSAHCASARWRATGHKVRGGRVCRAKSRARSCERARPTVGDGVVLLVGLLAAAAADAVHVEEGGGDDHRQRREQHECEAAGAVALLAGVDELLGAGGRRAHEQGGRRADRDGEQRADPSHGGCPSHAFAGAGAGGAVTSVGRVAASAAARAAFRSFSYQCRPSRPRPKRINAEKNVIIGGWRTVPRSRSSTMTPLFGLLESHLGAGGATPKGYLVGSVLMTAQNCTTAYSGWCVNWKFRKLGLLPPIS